MNKRDYDSTVARIAGNIAAGILADPAVHMPDDRSRKFLAETSVGLARAIVAEVKRTEPNALEPIP